MSFVKRIISSIFPAVFAAVSITAAVSAQNNAILYEGFDNYTGGKIEGWDKMSGSQYYSVENFGDSHGNCMAIKSSESSALTARYRFDKTEGNIYRVSLYARCDMPDGTFILSLLDEENNPYRTIKVGKDVQVYMGDGSSSFTKLLCEEYMSDSWYKFDIWLDMDNDKIQYTVTDKYGKLTVFENVCELGSFRGLSFSQYSNGNTLYLDDISVESATRTNIEKWLKEGVAVPDDIANEYEVTIATDKTGNIFLDDEEALLWADIKSCDAKSNTKTLHFELKDVDHRVVWSADEEITLSAGEETRIALAPAMKKYGTYRLEVTEGDDLLCHAHMSRSVKNTKLNKRLGLSTHTSRAGADLKVLELQKAAGFGFARENFRWNSDNEGNISNTATALMPFIDKCIELGIEPYALMRIECSPKYDNPDGGFTTSDEALKGIEE